MASKSHKRKRASTEDSEESALEALNRVHDLFYLEAKHCNTFQALAQHHLEQETDLFTLTKLSWVEIYPILKNAVVSFLTRYGPQIWPAQQQHRGHLRAAFPALPGAAPKRVKYTSLSNGLVGPIFAKDGRSMDQTQRRAFRQAHKGVEPTDEQQISGSRMGAAMQRYFSAAVSLMRAAQKDESLVHELEGWSGGSEATLEDEVVTPAALGGSEATLEDEVVAPMALELKRRRLAAESNVLAMTTTEVLVNRILTT